jgi:hypothetical protein
MKKSLVIICFFVFLSNFSIGQILPPNRYFFNNHLLDITARQASFGYSFRKLKINYNGFAIEIRRSADDARANVDFDISEKVSANSIVTITDAGTSGLTIGQTMTYNAFAGSQTIYIRTWYNQAHSSVGYDAIQTNALLQPKVLLNSSGSSNGLPSILFNGDNRERLVVGQPIENLTANGINATYMTVLKPTQNSKQQLSFGMQDANLNRWALQTNWTDDELYFDAADGITLATNRSFTNDFNLYFYKQYSFIRGTNNKTARYNQNITALTSSTAPSTSFTGGNFSIGYWYLNCCLANPGFYGNVTEVVMFKTDLTLLEIVPLEFNQMVFWQL